MLIRTQQMRVLEAAAQSSFVKRVAGHLSGLYCTCVVRLPDEAAMVEALLPDALHKLVRSGIARAGSYGLQSESSIAVFCALLFAVAPNFDRHPLCVGILGAESNGPEQRLDQLVETFTEVDWAAVRADYDSHAWHYKS